MVKEFTLTRTDLGVIITSSLCLGFSWSHIPGWNGDFLNVLINYIIPLVIGFLGYTFILM